MTTTDRDTTEDKRYSLHFGVQRSIRYHHHRERFFDRLHHVTDVTCRVGSIATMTLIITDLPPDWAWTRLLAAIVAATAAAVNLAAKPSAGAQRHGRLAARFTALENDILRAEIAPAREELDRLQIRRLEIEADEPPVLRVLDAACHDELIVALSQDPGHMSNITGWQRLWRHFFDIGAQRIQKQRG